jgi:hypothetical protein
MESGTFMFKIDNIHNRLNLVQVPVEVGMWGNRIQRVSPKLPFWRFSLLLLAGTCTLLREREHPMSKNLKSCRTPPILTPAVGKQVLVPVLSTKNMYNVLVLRRYDMHV